MKRILLAAALLPALLVPLVAPAARSEDGESFGEIVGPFLARHCVSCHAGPLAKGGLSLENLGTESDARRSTTPWRQVRDRVARGEMPPRGTLRPSPGARTAFVAWIDASLLDEKARAPIAPGRVTVRRLNRREYENTVRDLLGVAVNAEAILPADDVGHGFDNVGDVLSLPPVLLEKYLLAAEHIAARAIVDEGNTEPPVARYADRALKAQGGAQWPGRAPWTLSSNGEVHAGHAFERTGRYRLRVRAFGLQAGPDPARMEIRVDGRVLQTVDVKAEKDEPGTYEIEAEIEAGTHRVGAAFVNDYYQPNAEDPAERDRNLYVLHLEVEGPVDALPSTSFRRRLLPDPLPAADDRDALRAFVASVTPRAWRRPVSAEEIDRLLGVVDAASEETTRFETRARTVLTALLVSPHFVFRVEPEPEGEEEVCALTDHQLASRLSYFLWASLPDDALSAMADEGRLSEPGALEAQADRMLRDARATALADGFAAQWLKIGELSAARPDPDRFPDVDAALLADMRQETLLFFEAVLREDRDVRELLSAGFTFVSERLAAHYGMQGVRGAHMRRVAVRDDRRGGVLRQAGVLTATSNPDRTSPVKRGKWILETLLDRPPPPPPPEAGALDESGGTLSAASVREQMAQHRADPVCASCHDAMDPLGFALEHYDGVGRWRDADGSVPIDASGVLPDGRTLRGAGDLATILATDDSFLRSLAKHLLVYALGRGVGEADEPAVARLTLALGEEPTLRRLVLEIVRLDAFRLRARPSTAVESPSGKDRE